MSKAQPKRPATDKRAHNRKGGYVIQRCVEQATGLDKVAGVGGLPAWTDEKAYGGKVEADKALDDLASAGVFRVAQVYPAVELTVEKRDVVTSRKPV